MFKMVLPFDYGLNILKAIFNLEFSPNSSVRGPKVYGPLDSTTKDNKTKSLKSCKRGKLKSIRRMMINVD